MWHMDESFMYEWVIHINESCDIWMSHSCINESFIWMSHVTYGWVIHMRRVWIITYMNHDMTLSYSMYEWVIHMWHMNESFMYESRHDSFIFVTCYLDVMRYGVATISRMLKNIGLFCKRALQKRPIFCKETYIFKHPTNRSHPIHR